MRSLTEESGLKNSHLPRMSAFAPCAAAKRFSRTNGVAYWGDGKIHMDGLNRAIEVQKMVGAISGDVDVAKIVDTRYLPDDLKALR